MTSKTASLFTRDKESPYKYYKAGLECLNG